MGALLLFVLAAAALTFSGRSAFAAAAALAAALVAGVNATAFLGYSPILLSSLWLAVVATGWLFVRASPGRDRRPFRTVALVAIAAAVPVAVLPVPMDTDAQGFGMLALAIREGGALDTLAPWRPAIGWLYSPGALLVFAVVSDLSGASMPAVMLGVSHAIVLLIVALAWEAGREIACCASSGDTRASEEVHTWAWAACVSAALSVGTWTALLDSHYPAIFGLLFLLGYVVGVLRLARAGRLRDLLAAALFAAAVPLTHADTAIVLAMAAIAVAASVPFARPRVRPGRWLLVSGAVPAAAAVFILPWLLAEWPLIAAGVRSPFEVHPSHWRQMILLHGVVWPLLALAGALLWVRRGQWWAMAMCIWLALVIETSILGLIERGWPGAASVIYRYNFPFSLAWHGPIVPYLVLGAAALVWLVRRFRVVRLAIPGARTLAVTAAAAALFVVMADALLPMSRSVLSFHGALSSHADLRAMAWIRDHTGPGARVLNYPGDYEHLRDWESHWAPVVTERDCVYFRMQPFFTPLARAGGRDLESAYAEQKSMLAFWRDPADPSHAGRLAAAGIDYVLVPEAIGAPSSLARAWRWQPPAQLSGVRSAPAQAPYLSLVYEAGGAAVYRVSRGDGAPLEER